MKQYCVNCVWSINIVDSGLYCVAKEQSVKYSTTKVPNCKDYGYCGIDIITGKNHKEKGEVAENE